MDPLLTAREYFPILRKRGSHRLSSDPGFGVVCGFLTLVFLIRMTVNLAWLVVFGGSGVPLDLDGIESVHLLLCSAFLVSIGSLGAFRISLVVPEDSFLSLEPLYRPFMARLRVFTLTRSPLFPIAWGFLVCYAAGLCILRGGPPRFPFPLVFCVLLVAGGSAGTLAILRLLRPRREELRLLEFLFLLILVGANPDMVNIGGTVMVLVAGARIPWEPGNPWFLGGCAAAFLAAFWLSLLVAAGRRAAHGIAKTARARGSGRRRDFDPLLRWYLRIIPPRVWLLTYLFLLPFLISGGIGRGGRIGACVAFALFACVSFAAALVRMDWELISLWGRPLFGEKRGNLLLQPLGVHLAIAAPALVWGFFRIAAVP